MAKFDFELLKRPKNPEPSSTGWIWIVYVALFVLSIPWYLPGESPPSIWLGLPYWVWISLSVTLVIALFTVFVIRCYWLKGE